MHSDKTKEGLSLFGKSAFVPYKVPSDSLSGILNTARTSLGQILMRQWFLRPSLSIPTITARHDAIECLNRPENVRTANTIFGNIKGISNVPRILRLLKSGKAGLGEWQGIVKARRKHTLE